MARKNNRWTEKEYLEFLQKSPKLQKKVFGSGNSITEVIPKCFTPVKELPEDEVQELFIKWKNTPENQFLYPEIESIYAIPNADKRGLMAIQDHLKTGLESGIPDIHLPVSRKPFFSFYIEFKTWKAYNTKNNGCSDNQLKWIERLKRYGNKVEVMWNPFDAIEVVKNYIGKKLI